MGMKVISGRNPNNGRPIEVTVRDGLVYAIREVRLEQEAWLSPGFIDLQVNGYGGFDVNLDQPDPDAIISLTESMIATGVTAYLPTIITAAEDKIIAALKAVAVARQRNRLAAGSIPYVHVEGPCIDPADGPRGAHPLAHVRPPSLAEFNRWQQASGGLVGMVTLSPHYAGAAEYISNLAAQGIHVALGHTECSADEIRRAVDAGARLSTHLGNGIAATIPRHRNVLWPQLAEDRLTATMIADGHHLPADMIKVILRAKGVTRSILVSDAVAVAGLPPAEYETPVGGLVQLHPDGRLSLKGTGFLAGAALPLKEGIVRAVAMAGISLGDAVTMATENPGRFTGSIGVLRVGAPADLVRFQVDSGGTALRVGTVLLKGKEWT
jgi:N-acetylglucosamine-6-phosphate deacetylase